MSFLHGSKNSSALIPAQLKESKRLSPEKQFAQTPVRPSLDEMQEWPHPETTLQSKEVLRGLHPGVLMSITLD